MSYNNDLGEFGMSREELEEQHRIMRQIEERRSMAAGRGGHGNSGGGDMNMNVNSGGGGYATTSHARSSATVNNTNAHSYNNNVSSNMATAGATASSRTHTRGYDNHQGERGARSSGMATEPDIEGLPEPKTKISEIPGIKSVTSNNIILPEMSISRGKTAMAIKQAPAANNITGDVAEGGVVLGKENESANVAAVDQGDERIVRCLECSTVLSVLKTASLVSCPTCWSVSPAVYAA